MRCTDPGHVYEIAERESFGRTRSWTLRFLKKEKVPIARYLHQNLGVGASEIEAMAVAVDPPTATVLVTEDGTTNEEVLEVLIDRTEWLQAQFPCPENVAALEGMRVALAAFNSRTAKRQAQGVEGQLKNHT